MAFFEPRGSAAPQNPKVEAVAPKDVVIQPTKLAPIIESLNHDVYQARWVAESETKVGLIIKCQNK